MPRGIFERSDEHKRHISEALKGKAKTPEHCAAVSRACKGRKLSPEGRANIGRAQIGRKHPWSLEQRAELSAKRKGRSTLLRRYGISDEEQSKQKAVGNRWCSFHKGFVSPAEFNGSKKTVCKACAPAENRIRLLKHNFHTTQEWYDDTLAEQGGGCAICGSTHLRAGQKFLHIDHNHETGKVRGILCNCCNLFLGVFEVPSFRERALAYLERYS